MNYYRSREVTYGYKGQIYTYDDSGNKEIVVWNGTHTRESPEQAIDDACEYADSVGMEIEIG